MSGPRSRNGKYESDAELARRLNVFNAVGVTENAVFPEDISYASYEPKTLIDQTLEILDPTPNIYTLFGQFDKRFFNGKLVSVEVRWSARMTSCAGTCTFHSKSKYCVISLSAPLLKLRPRKDLVETLLHEMIHAYLFLTNNNRDRDGHGPEFCKIMYRINKEAGTRITIYHSFHDEVRLYQQHWWRCDGPCQTRRPYFGMVRRAMNRAPGPSDSWWAEHQRTCNGRFIKVREPEKSLLSSKQNASNENKKPLGNAANSNKKLDNWFVPEKSKIPDKNGKIPVKTPIFGATKFNETKMGKPSGLVKLGSSTNNVHGWGTGGPGSSSSSTVGKAPSGEKSGGILKYSGTVGGIGTGKSNLLKKFSSPISHGPSQDNERKLFSSPVKKKPKMFDQASEHPSSSLEKSKIQFHNCPVCDKSIQADLLNDHLDACLVKESTSSEADKKTVKVSCVIDANRLSLDIVYDTAGQLNENHVVKSVSERTENRDGTKKPETSHKKESENDSEQSYVCLVCNLRVSKDIELADHLEECVQAIFNDDSFDVGNETLNDIIIAQNETPSPPKIDLTVGRFPCPVCLTPIMENLMNEHLDICLVTE